MSKRALVLSGGGSKGSWQAGILPLVAADKYDAIFGVSVGALNGLVLATNKYISEGLKQLDEFWNNLTTKQVYRKRTFGWLAAPFATSVYDSTALGEWVDLYVQQAGRVHRYFSCGYVDAGLGVYVRHSLNHENYPYGLRPTEREELVQAVIASSAFPGMLTPAEGPYGPMIDGGVRNVTPLGDAIDWGATEIDVFHCHAELPSVDGKDLKTIDILKRSMAIMMDELMENDIRTCRNVNKLVAARKAGLDLTTNPNHKLVKVNVYRPSSGFKMDPLDFSPTAIRYGMAQGRADGRQYSRKLLTE